MGNEMRRVLKDIMKDAEADIDRYEGMPFTGKAAAMIHGEQNAMIAALANIMETLLPEDSDDS